MLAQADVGESLQDVLSQIIALLPTIVLFLVILVVGWFVAKAIAKIVDRVLERVGFDRAVERGGVGRALEPTRYDASTILAKVVFYALMLFVLQLAFGLFGPNPISALLFGVIAFLPRIFVAIVIVVIAAAIASVVRDLVTASIGGLSYGRVLANLASATILLIGVFAALDQLRIAPAIVTGLFYAILAVIVGSAIVAVGGGGIVPMRRQWEKAIDKVEDEAPRLRRARHARDYEALTREELDEIARDRDLRGRSDMTRDELAAALREDDATRELRREPAHEPVDGDTTSYHQLTYEQLMELAQERDLAGRSEMDKDELVAALRHDDRTHELRRV
ncbi:mechanosensitive ion channel family protein [Nitriliruptor alkaliphilus]|uniref:mechanosensitive ion channel family protein n=1 Tax=Nitriliruptor alkaliphilus TaxID=427918 RepID=UPI000695E0FC|nr:hypothetical protein [Nitriliruptor alkaliphilus]